MRAADGRRRHRLLEAALSAAPAAAPAERYDKRWWTLGVLCLSLMVIGVDNTILNVALPSIVRQLNAQGSALQWIIDAYTIVFAGLLLTAGSLGDRLYTVNFDISKPFSIGLSCTTSSTTRPTGCEAFRSKSVLPWPRM